MCATVTSITLCLFARLPFPTSTPPSFFIQHQQSTYLPPLTSSLAVSFLCQPCLLSQIADFTHSLSNCESDVIFLLTTLCKFCKSATFCKFASAWAGCTSSRQMGRKSREMEEPSSPFHHIASLHQKTFAPYSCTRILVLFHQSVPTYCLPAPLFFHVHHQILHHNASAPEFHWNPSLNLSYI